MEQAWGHSSATRFIVAHTSQPNQLGSLHGLSWSRDLRCCDTCTDQEQLPVNRDVQVLSDLSGEEGMGAVCGEFCFRWFLGCLCRQWGSYGGRNLLGHRGTSCTPQHGALAALERDTENNYGQKYCNVHLMSSNLRGESSLWHKPS